MDDCCRNCGNEIVHDLRESRTRYMFRDLEARWQSKQHGRFIKAGAIAGVITLVLMIALMSTCMNSQPQPDRSRVSVATQRVRDRADARTTWGWMKIVGGVTFCVAFGVMTGATAIFGRRRRFPYVDEYEA